MTTEVLRAVVAGGCVLLIGMNVAFLLHERRRAERFAWRVFVLGKSLVTAYIGLDLWLNSGGADWRLPLAAVGVVVTHAGIVALMVGYPLRRRIGP